MNAKKLTTFGLLTAVALVLSYIDRLFPLDFIAPGVRLGLGNTVLLFAVYLMRPMDAMALMGLKVTVTALLFGFASFPYSLAGGILSLIAMLTGYRIKLGCVTVSILGGTMHNVGQILIAAMLTTPILLISYLPPLLVFGVIMGSATGLVAKYAMRAMAKADRTLLPRLEGTDILGQSKAKEKTKP